MFTVLYRDSQLLIVDKPAGWLVHRTALDRHEPKIVLQTVRDQIGQPVWPVHRLDKGTSGALAFALDPDTAAAMGQRFETGEALRKRYKAIVRGWPGDELLIDHPLKRLAEDMRPDRMAVQQAITFLRTLLRGTLPIAQGPFPMLRWAEIELEPRTGRRHQLRRHLKHLAHPILGDSTYGKGALNRAVAADRGEHRLWLHLHSLQFEHPDHGRLIEVSAPLPPSWEAAWHAAADPALIQGRTPGSTV